MYLENLTTNPDLQFNADKINANILDFRVHLFVYLKHTEIFQNIVSYIILNQPIINLSDALIL